MATFISHSPEETAALGESWGRALTAGSVLALQGDLGAGKTELVKGIARGLGVTERVHSPTFALLNLYTSGRLTLHHLDLYRLSSREEVVGAGLEETMFQPRGITVIEWPERWCERAGESVRPMGWRWVSILSPDETVREIVYDDSGT